MTNFTFQNSHRVLTNVDVEFPKWFPDSDAHILWMAINQAREGAAGSSAKVMIALLESAYIIGQSSIVDTEKAKAIYEGANETLSESIERATAAVTEADRAHEPLSKANLADLSEFELIQILESRFPVLAQRRLSWDRALLEEELAGERKHDDKTTAVPLAPSLIEHYRFQPGRLQDYFFETFPNLAASREKWYEEDIEKELKVRLIDIYPPAPRKIRDNPQA